MSPLPASLRIGCVSLGQGPRPDLEDLHLRLFGALGRKVELVWRHVLDGISDVDLAAMAARPGEPAIRSVLRSADPEEIGPLGRGWTSAWLDRDSFAPLVARTVHALDPEVALTIVCAAEVLPTLALSTRHPVVLPSQAMAGYAQILAASRPKAHIALVTYGDRQQRQQRDGWAALPWARALTISFSANGGDLEKAAADLAPLSPELIFVWAYGAGIQPGSPGPDELAARTGAPVILASAAAVNFAHALLPPGRGDQS
jgi:protein AroM